MMMKLAGVVLLLAVIAFQNLQLKELRGWRSDVLVAVGDAVDIRDKKERLVPVKAKDAVLHIQSLGRFKSDAIRLRAEARAADAHNIIRVDGLVDATNKEQVHALQTELGALRGRYLDLLAHQRMRGGSSAAIDDSGGRGATPMPGLPDAGSRAARSAEADRLPDTGATGDRSSGDFSLAERYEASIYATQLDQLITAVIALGKIDPNTPEPEEAK
ncbi:MAG: hypothetical protein ACK4SJ_11220 [Sphingorhabdus sp.]